MSLQRGPPWYTFSFRFILCEFAWIFFIKLSLASFLPPEWGWNALAKSPQPGQTHSLDFTFLDFCFHTVHIVHSAPRYFFFSNRKPLSPPFTTCWTQSSVQVYFPINTALVSSGKKKKHTTVSTSLFHTYFPLVSLHLLPFMFQVFVCITEYLYCSGRDCNIHTHQGI